MDELAAEALAAEEAGDDTRAAELYRRLEREAPDDPVWKKKLAGAYRRLGRKDDRIAALIRAAEAHERRGEAMKGIATLKIARELAPEDPRLAAAADRIRHAAAPRARRMRADSYPRPERGAQPLAVIPLLRRARSEARLDGAIVEVEAAALERPASFDPRREPDEVSVEVDILPPIPLFSSLDAAAFSRLLDGATTEHRDPRQTVFSRGDRAGALYVVVDGAVDVILEGTQPVARLESGAFFGEMSLFLGKPRNATVVTAEPTELLVIDHADVLELVRREPSVLEVLVAFFRRRLVENVLARLGLPEAAQAGLRASFVLLDVVKGTTIITQGQPSPGLFVLVDGGLDVIHQSASGATGRVASLGPGAFAGEISTLAHVPATATVTAAATSLVLALPREQFARVASAHPALLQHVTALAAERIEALRRPAWC